nr:pyridoxal 5'-phosphate synthase [Streptomyces sp. SID5468]
MRVRLRTTPALTGPFPAFEVSRAEAAPGPLFLRWLTEALDDGVPEPHVTTLSTADERGRPSARVLMLRDVDPDRCAFRFASEAASRKGRELAANPYAALSWYWPRHGRQIRAAGPVAVLDRAAARADFLGRGEASRISGFTGSMSAPLESEGAYADARERARRTVAAEPEAVPDGHTVYELRAEEMEFFQGDPARFHRRLCYHRQDGNWTSGLLWP